MDRRRIASLFAIPLLLAACGGSSPAPSTGGGESTGPGASEGGTASQPAASQPAASQPAASQGGGGGGGGKATVHLVITGGSVAGTYDADITEGGCSTGATGAGQFAVASVTLDPDTAFDGPQITIYDAAAAGGAGTDAEYSAAFVFDNYATTVEVNPKLSRGSGTIKLDNRGGTATVTLEGTSADGDQVSATIECHTVKNF